MKPLHQLLPQFPWPAALAEQGVKHWRLDSRQVQAGDGFLALPGTQADGRQYIDAAIAQGASLVLVAGERFICENRGAVPVVQVPELKVHVGELLAQHYGTPADWPVVAVTGTNGKTSVAFFIQQLMQLLQTPWGSMGTLGACVHQHCEPLGLTTADVASVHRHWADFRAQGARGLVLEASSHALHQERLAGLPITTGVWTNLGRDHLDYHGDATHYAAAKALLWQQLGITRAVYSLDDPQVANTVPTALKGFTFGKRPENQLHYSQLRCHGQGMSFVLHHEGKQWDVEAPLLGAFNVENLLAALAALMSVGHPLAELLPLLPQLAPVRGRMEQVIGEQGPTVVVDFAHTAEGLNAALSALRAHFEGNIICVFGCGGDRDQGKRPLMAAAAEQGADVIWLTSDNPRTESPAHIMAQVREGFSSVAKVHSVEDRAQAIHEAIAQARATDVVLIAGKGHEEEQIIGQTTVPFSDVAVAREALKAWRATP